MLRILTICRAPVLAGLSCVAMSCGIGTNSGKSPDAPQSPLQKALNEAEATSGVPQRVILAVGFTESEMSPEPSKSLYIAPEGKSYLGFASTETAFGLSKSELDVEDNSDELAAQILAYGRWLKQRLDPRSTTKLNRDTNNQNNVLRWVAAIANEQVADDRNVRAIWARSVVRILNEGRVLVDNGSVQGKIVLSKNEPAIQIEQLESDSQAYLRIEDDLSEVGNARRLALAFDERQNASNRPKRIEVVHCAFNLAACVALQGLPDDSPVHLGAHYIVPTDDKVIGRPMQLLDHEQSVRLTDSTGKTRLIEDAVVIMLAGSSGRYQDGVRLRANPLWYTPWQLRKFGGVVRGVCQWMDRREGVEFADCVSNNPKTGVKFHVPENYAQIHWGEIPDFDNTIFSAFLGSSESSNNLEVILQMLSGDPDFIFDSGSEIRFHSRLPLGTRFVRMQRASRCDDKKVVWDTISSEPLKNTVDWYASTSFYDSGINEDGKHFIRVLAYDDDAELLGWASTRVNVGKFESNYRAVSDACY